MSLLFFLLRNSRAVLVLAVAGGIFSGITSTAILVLISTVLVSADASMAFFLWSFIALSLVSPISRAWSGILLIRLTQKATFDLRMQLCRRILAAPLHHLEELGAHKLLAMLSEDISSITGALVFIPILFINVAIFVGCIFYLAFLRLSLLAPLLGFMVVGIISYQLLLSKAVRVLSLAREEEDSLFKHFSAVTEGTKELKLHKQRREDFLSYELETTAATYQRYSVIGSTLYAIASSWGGALFLVPIGLVLFGFPWLKFEDPDVLTGYVMTLLFLRGPLDIIISAVPALARSNISMQKINKLELSLNTEPEQGAAGAVASVPGNPWSRLEFTDLTHSYQMDEESHRFVLGPINLKFRRGELVFLTGGNGSGKTTLAKLITGLYEVESGEIRVDGQALTSDDIEGYRQHFSAVFSDFYLFQRLLGLKTDDLDEKTRKYLIELKLEEKVQVNDGLLSTLALSQGQRKRLALLTAYLENRSFYIFDEWAADQDPQFKDVFYFQLLPELKARGKTVLVISHDDRYYHLADRIIKLDYGKLVYDLPIDSFQQQPTMAAM